MPMSCISSNTLFCFHLDKLYQGVQCICQSDTQVISTLGYCNSIGYPDLDFKIYVLSLGFSSCLSSLLLVALALILSSAYIRHIVGQSMYTYSRPIGRFFCTGPTIFCHSFLLGDGLL